MRLFRHISAERTLDHAIQFVRQARTFAFAKQFALRQFGSEKELDLMGGFSRVHFVQQSVVAFEPSAQVSHELCIGSKSLLRGVASSGGRNKVKQAFSKRTTRLHRFRAKFRNREKRLERQHRGFRHFASIALTFAPSDSRGKVTTQSELFDHLMQVAQSNCSSQSEQVNKVRIKSLFIRLDSRRSSVLLADARQKLNKALPKQRLHATSQTRRDTRNIEK
ncbi:MAG: hypothetical protein MHM6MM_003155 [Cercozoa sp. M6MM]